MTTPRHPAARRPCGACLARQRPVRIERGSTVGVDTITIDGTQRDQTMDGFGYAMTDTSAYEIDRLPHGRRLTLMRQLFDGDRGIGISWIRIVMGPSDFTVVAPPWYSYRPSAATRFDVGRARTGSPRGDYSHIIPLLRSASRASKGEISFFANPHSAPGWMKRTQTMSNLEPNGCILGYCVPGQTTRDVRDAYVDYFLDFVKTYRAHGVPIASVGVQNEPGSPANFPSGVFAPADQVDFVQRLRRAFAQQDPPLTTKVLAETTGPSDAFPIVTSVVPPDAIDGISYHCYGLDHAAAIREVSAVATLHTQYPRLSLHETECTQDARSPWPKTIDVLIGQSRSGANSVAGWNLALDAYGGPQSFCAAVQGGICTPTVGGSGMTAPVVIAKVKGRTTARFTREYYEMGHFTKFVRPKAVRIASTEPNGISNVAFENRDGSRVLVVHNTGSTAKRFAVDIGRGRMFRVPALPADAIATFTWRP